MENKLLRVLMGTCSTAIWCVMSKQWTPEQAIQEIHKTLMKVAQAQSIDLSQSSQIERLRDEAVIFMDSAD